MTDNNGPIESFIPSGDKLTEAITYEQLLNFFAHTLQTEEAYPCPICKHKSKIVHTYSMTGPHFPVVVDFKIIPNIRSETTAIYCVAVQCETCGRMDFFSMATLLEWLEKYNKEEQNASAE